MKSVKHERGEIKPPINKHRHTTPFRQHTDPDFERVRGPVVREYRLSGPNDLLVKK